MISSVIIATIENKKDNASLLSFETIFWNLIIPTDIKSLVVRVIVQLWPESSPLQSYFTVVIAL